MAGALAYRPDASGALIFQIKEGSYNTDSLIEFLTDLHTHFGADKITLIWDNLPSHKSKAMTAWINSQRHWLTVERLPGYAHDLNPIEMVWGNLKTVGLANWRASRFPDCGPNKVRSGKDERNCQENTRNTSPSFARKLRSSWSSRIGRSPKWPANTGSTRPLSAIG